MTSSIPVSFEQISLAAPVLQAIKEIGYEQPSPIQAQGIPLLLAGGDLLGQAQTGTGKTAAFALPILSRIDLSRRVPQALVLAPTRELAIQVAEAFQSYARHLEGFHILPVYGGQGMGQQLRQLARGVHVIVGTPGRVMDHLRRGTLALDGLQTLVLDEADEMLNMGFLEDVEWILEHTPPTRQIALFSATMPSAIRKIADKHLRNPQEVRIKAKTATVEAISQFYWYVSGVHKLDALTRILEAEEFDAMLVFVRTKNETVELAEKLEARGFEAAAMNGDMTQQLREKVIERLKGGQLDIVVATDVAARGLDVERITHVINYDIPYDAEAYVHRIGRTGRAGRTGKAILFVAPREKRMLRVIEQVTRQTIGEMRLPSLRDIADRRVEQFKSSLVETLAQEDLEFYRGLVADLVGEDVGEPADLAAAMAYLMHRERPLQAPPETAPPPPAYPARESRGLNVALYRLDVGRRDGVLPKDVVGAIANETGLSSKEIGKITLYDEYSTVELPDGLPEAFFRRLGKVWLRNRLLAIRPMESAGARPGKPPAPRKPKGEKSFARKEGGHKPKGRRD
ncbi:MAG TPA: DEAD/DEAH box helicase [Methylococcaceae bacterium]|nr:DEAD/DEAH box helicase [Methylococcaceae bacterium]